jgi:cytochrome P450
MGSKRAIAVNGWEAVKEVLNKDEFSGRPDFFVFRDEKLKTILGIMFATNNDLWKTQRRFALRRLRDWGFGKITLEGLIQEEIQETCEEMDEKVKENKGIVPIANAFGVPVINILWAVVAGKRFSHDDDKLKELLRRINESFRTQSHANNLINEYPFLRHLPYFSADWQKLIAARDHTKDFIQEAIDEHIKTRDPLNPRDFLDDFLHEMEKEKNNANTTFFRDQLVTLVLDIFNAGAESTSNTIAFGLLYMILYPDVQEKVYREIQEVVGSDRIPSFEDRTRMHYTEAVLLELLRYATITPQAVPHYTVTDTTLNGYDIPKDTLVFVSLDSVNFDKTVWGDPENFRPERYLDSEGKFVKPEQTVQFGLGKRVCIGYSLARMNYFLMFTSMIQRYRFGVVPGQAKPSTEPLPGFTFAPKPFSALLTPRNL